VSCCFSFCGGFIRICLCSIFRGNGFASQFCYVGYCVVGLVNLILAETFNLPAIPSGVSLYCYSLECVWIWLHCMTTVTDITRDWCYKTCVIFHASRTENYLVNTKTGSITKACIMRKQTVKDHDNILYAIHLKNSKKFWLTLPSHNASLATPQSAMLTTWLSLLFPFGFGTLFLHYLHNNVFWHCDWRLQKLLILCQKTRTARQILYVGHPVVRPQPQQQ